MILFLDFDGVLHPVFPLPELPEEENQFFAYAARLEEVLRGFPEVQIVISSTWRFLEPLDALRARFSPDIAARILGTLQTDMRNSGKGVRHAEILAWLSSQGLSDQPWLALDDDPDNFHSGENVVLCGDGFRDEEEYILRKRISSQF